MNELKLEKSLCAYGTKNFESVLTAELTELGTAALPLQQGLKTGSVALDHDLKLTKLGMTRDGNLLDVRFGAFYSGINAGCSCADDPGLIDESIEYCEFVVSFHLESGKCEIRLTG